MFNPSDIALIVVVALMVCGIAYIHSPIAKSIIYMLPMPFTAAFVSTGGQVNATNLAGIVLLTIITWLAWFLYVKKKVNIVLADFICVAFYCLAGMGITYIIPRDGESGIIAYWLVALVIVVSSVFLMKLKPVTEDGHKSPLPVYLKIPGVILICLLAIALKTHI